MSAPAALSCAVAAVLLGVPVISVAGQLEAGHRAAGAADAAALAAADAAAGWIEAEPCAIAAEAAAAQGAIVASCAVDAERGEARVAVRVGTPFGGVERRARAGPAGE